MKARIGLLVAILLLFILLLRPWKRPSHETENLDSMIEVGTLLRSYIHDYGEIPPGNETAISQAFLGKNPRGIVYVEFKENASSSKIFIDPWGTPYRIAALNAKWAEVRSAGPDKLFGTADDRTLAYPWKTLRPNIRACFKKNPT